MAGTYPFGFACTSGLGRKDDTLRLWISTYRRKSATKSQHCYHWTWLGLPVLAGVVIGLSLGFLFWPLVVAFVLSLPFAVWAGRSVAIVNGRKPKGGRVGG